MEFTDLLFNLFSGELSYSFDGTIVKQVRGGGGWVGMVWIIHVGRGGLDCLQ